MGSDKPLGVRGLSFAYEGEAEQHEVFADVSFAVGPGEILGVFGPNGSGKTSLLRCVAGLVTPTSGDVRIRPREGALAVSLIPQDCPSSFLNGVSLRRNLEWIVPGSSVFAREFLADIDYDIDLSRRPPQCSGGMLQLVAIIRALAARPALVLADEPFSNLDVNVARRVKAAFTSKIREVGSAAVLVLHNLDDMIDMCDHVLVIPGRPFSTEPRPHSSQALILRNGNARTTVGAGSHDQTFIELARRVLDPSAAHGPTAP